MESLTLALAARAERRWTSRISCRGDVAVAKQFVADQVRRMPAHFRVPLLILSAFAWACPFIEIPPITRFYDSLFLLAWLEGVDRE